MIRIVQKIFIVFMVLFITSCADRYWPKLDKYDNPLVVDGMITNEPGPYIIKLTLASQVYNPVIQPVMGAHIWVTDNFGNIETFIEIGPGQYVNSDPEFIGIVGRSYKISIVTRERKIYVSPFEKLNPPVEIENLYTEREIHEEAGYNHLLSGLQFYLDTKPTDKDSVYLAWKLVETYKYEADFKIKSYYDGSLKVFPNSDSLKTCYKTTTIPEIHTFNLTILSEKQLTHFPLNYVSTEDRRLSIRYSLLVKQLSLTKKAYQYWNAIKEQNNEQGSLYTTVPYQIRGNIENIDDKSEPVMGGFTVAGVSSKRIFVKRPLYIPFRYPRCDSTNYMDDISFLFTTGPDEWPIYLTMNSDFKLVYPEQSCVDCRQDGGVIEKPDFWVDE